MILDKILGFMFFVVFPVLSGIMIVKLIEVFN
jgi:hypothetical protein